MLMVWRHPQLQHRFLKRVSMIDLDRDEDRVEWRRRLAESKLVSNELPPDRLPDSNATLETG